MSLIAAFSLGCSPAEDAAPDVEVTWSVTPDPPRVGRTTVTVQLADSLGRPIRDAHVDMEGTMTHPGMQPVLAEAYETSPGVYEATFDLTMRGDWIVLMDVTLPDGRSLERQRDIPGVSDL